MMFEKSRTLLILDSREELTAFSLITNYSNEGEGHMNESLAYCGLLCNGCPIYLATKEVNTTLKARMKSVIAQMSKELYGLDQKPEDITDCDGCWSANDRLFPGCLQCQIRICAREKELENCAYCIDYPCGKLNDVFKSDPAAKMRLDFIKRINY